MFFHPSHLYCVTTLLSKTNTTANIGVKCESERMVKIGAEFPKLSQK